MFSRFTGFLLARLQNLTIKLDKENVKTSSSEFESEDSKMAFDAMVTALEKHVPFYGLLNADQRLRFATLTANFMSSKKFLFPRDFERDRALVKLLISALASQFLLGAGEDLLSELSTIEVLESIYIHNLGEIGTAVGLMETTSIEDRVIQAIRMLPSQITMLTMLLNITAKHLEKKKDQVKSKKILVSLQLLAETVDVQKQRPTFTLPNSANNLRAFGEIITELRSFQSTIESFLTSLQSDILYMSAVDRIDAEKSLTLLSQTLQKILDYVDKNNALFKGLPAQRTVTKVTLPYSSVLQSLLNQGPSRGTAFHEFAHCVDMKYGLSFFLDSEPSLSWVASWRQILQSCTWPCDFDMENIPASISGQREEFADFCALFIVNPVRAKTMNAQNYAACLALFGYEPPIVKSNSFRFFKSLLFKQKLAS